MLFFLLINIRMPTYNCNCWHFNIYEQEKFHAELNMVFFITREKN